LGKPDYSEKTTICRNRITILLNTNSSLKACTILLDKQVKSSLSMCVKGIEGTIYAYGFPIGY
jgi:hypothetical protein